MREASAFSPKSVTRLIATRDRESCLLIVSLSDPPVAYLFLVRCRLPHVMNEALNTRIQIRDGFYLSRIVRADKAAYMEDFTDPEVAATN